MPSSTISRAYVQLLTAFGERHGRLTAAERVNELLGGPLAERSALLKFYTRARLESTAARQGWVEPDVAPLALDAVLEPRLEQRGAPSYGVAEGLTPLRD